MPGFEYVVLWLAIIGILAAYGLRVLRDVRFVFAPPLISAMLIAGILIRSWFEFDSAAKEALLDMDYYFITLIYALLCLSLFSWGFERGFALTRAAPQQVNAANTLPPIICLLTAAAVAAVGFAGQFVVAQAAGGLVAYYSVAHGGAVDYSGMSGYIHGLPNFIWAAMAIVFAVILLSPESSLSARMLFAILLLAVVANTYLFGNRNGVVRLAMILGGMYVFVKRPNFTRSLPIYVALGFGAIVILVLPNIRNETHLGSDVSLFQAVKNFLQVREDNDGYIDISTERGGHEFFFNVAVVQSSWITGTYDYGASYIYPFINFIPRSIWPEKPYETEFVVNVFDLTYSVTGWWAGAGAAWSAIGHSFLAFSWAGALVWGLVGHISGKVFGRAWAIPNLMNLGALVSLLIALVFWGTQSFSAFFFAWFFTHMPFFALSVVAWMIGISRRVPIYRSAGHLPARFRRPFPLDHHRRNAIG